MSEAMTTERAAREREPEDRPAAPPARRRRRLPGPAALWAVSAIAVVNALVWAFLLPVFQTPDEPVHIGYAQYVAETGRLPTPGQPVYAPSPDANITFQRIPWSGTGHPSWSVANDRELHRELAKPLNRVADGGAGYLASNPPLYYALEALPYRAALGGDFLDRVYAMRALSALLAGLTTAFVFLFLRELLPRTPWAWTTGALAVAFQPVFGFISGGVNNDTLLWTCSAALFWLVARAFRRGLSPGTAIAMGLAFAAGALTKTSMFGLLPGLLLALALVVWRTSTARRRALIGAAAALAALAVPLGGWLLSTRYLLDRGGSTTAGFTAVPHTSIGAQLSYIWQFYLPKLPFMSAWFTGTTHHPIWDVYFQGFVGRFGWYAFGFPVWVSWLALGVAVIVFALAVSALLRGGVWRRRWHELLAYGAMAGGLALLVNVAGYRYKISANAYFEQARYLFPLLALYGGLVAVAARGAGRRWGPVFGVAFVVVAAANSLFSQLLTASHYYG